MLFKRAWSCAPVCAPARTTIVSGSPQAYRPDTPEVRREWAQYPTNVSAADAIAGEHLAQIAAASHADDTIVFYFADHGAGLPRNKRWPGNSGLHVPLVVYFPPKCRHLAPKEYTAGAKSDRLVSFVDFAPTVLSLAGIATAQKEKAETLTRLEQALRCREGWSMRRKCENLNPTIAISPTPPTKTDSTMSARLEPPMIASKP